MLHLTGFTKTKLRSAARATLDRLGVEIKRKPRVHDKALYHRLYPAESIEKRRFYNVGAGGHHGFGINFDHPFWTNLDLKRPIGPSDRQYNPDRDIPHDLLASQPLPIGDNEAEIILSQYSVEHVPDTAAQFFFKEALRALKPNGILKVVTPNAALDVNAFMNRDETYYDWLDFFSSEEAMKRMGYRIPLNQASFEQVFLTHFAAAVSDIHTGDAPEKFSDSDVRNIMGDLPVADALNYFTSRCPVEVQRKHRFNHMNWWTPEKISSVLKEVGFKKTTILAPRQSAAPVMRNGAHFDRLWNQVATFVEAVK